MRLDLFDGGKRPWYLLAVMHIAKWRIGIFPGPPLAISYRPDLFPGYLIGYMQRPLNGFGSWSKGEAELFAAFVSRLNSCNF